MKKKKILVLVVTGIVMVSCIACNKSENTVITKSSKPINGSRQEVSKGEFEIEKKATSTDAHTEQSEAVQEQIDSNHPLSGTPNYTVNYAGTEDNSGYLFPESSDFKFQGYSAEYEAWVYQYGVNEIYGKHGYSFQTPQVSKLFSSKTWYSPDSGFNDSVFSEIEKYNIDFLSQCMTATGKDGGFGLPSGKHTAAENAELNKENKKAKNQLADLQLNHSYTTRFPDVNLITYPRLIFDYPDGWTISKEEVTAFMENVILTNERGVNIEYSQGNPNNANRNGYKYTVFANRADVSKVADSNFVPGYIQDTDYSSLGKFMVAKVKVTGELNRKVDSDYTDIDGALFYVVAPESQTGTLEYIQEIDKPYAEFDFGYGSFVSYSPDGQFTEQEVQEVQQILSSFRVE